jgi:hypothetical protein
MLDLRANFLRINRTGWSGGMGLVQSSARPVILGPWGFSCTPRNPVTASPYVESVDVALLIFTCAISFGLQCPLQLQSIQFIFCWLQFRLVIYICVPFGQVPPPSISVILLLLATVQTTNLVPHCYQLGRMQRKINSNSSLCSGSFRRPCLLFVLLTANPIFPSEPRNTSLPVVFS